MIYEPAADGHESELPTAYSRTIKMYRENNIYRAGKRKKKKSETKQTRASHRNAKFDKPDRRNDREHCSKRKFIAKTTATIAAFENLT